ncbi:MAG TPA: zinc-binding alcohol dehydrogenase family protein [Candidatus Binatia bacterium]|nr:zinc-binding alcohol dehydrogenase family protein [Candidatus Binatia bacterium]
MRALVLDRPGPATSGPLRLVDLPDPEPGPGELLVDVAACAVCRTDLQIAEGDLEPRRLPIVLGHQPVGRVAGIGPGVEGWRIGDRVGALWLAEADGTCRFCRRGLENLCEAARFTGWDRDGGFAERLLVRADFAVRVPEGLAPEAAAPLLCGGVIGYRALQLTGLEPGGRLGLFGFGASARLVIQVAVHLGYEVFVWTRAERDRLRALELGARWAGDIGTAAPVGPEAAITFAPVGDVVVEALRSVDRGGTVVVNAIHLDRIPSFDYRHLWWERSLRSVANVTRRDATEFLALAGEIPVVTDVDVFELAAGNTALARLAAGEIAGAAVLVTGR